MFEIFTQQLFLLPESIYKLASVKKMQNGQGNAEQTGLLQDLCSSTIGL